mmetsp:Transcript_5485/g.7295  ORF Transcript_5485/g.7295 Transcript_5485/m.7295 type:complete len:647 (+) Transcript_5485:796-2736(+)
MLNYKKTLTNNFILSNDYLKISSVKKPFSYLLQNKINKNLLSKFIYSKYISYSLALLSRCSRKSLYAIFNEEYILKKSNKISFSSLIKIVLFSNLNIYYSKSSLIFSLVKALVFHRFGLLQRIQFNFKGSTLALIAKGRNLSGSNLYSLSNKTRIVVKFNKPVLLTTVVNSKYSIQIYKKKLSFFFRIMNDLNDANYKPVNYYKRNLFLLTGFKGHGKKLFLSTLSKIINLTIISISTFDQINFIHSVSIKKLLFLNTSIKRKQNIILYLDDSRISLLKNLSILKSTYLDVRIRSLFEKKRLLLFIDIDSYKLSTNYKIQPNIMNFSVLNLKERLGFLQFYKFKALHSLYLLSYCNFKRNFLQTTGKTFDDKNIKNLSKMNHILELFESKKIIKNYKLSKCNSKSGIDEYVFYFLLKKKLTLNLLICLSSATDKNNFKLYRYLNSLGIYTFEFRNKSIFYLNFIDYFLKRIIYGRPSQQVVYAIKNFNIRSMMKKSIFKNKILFRNFFYFLHFLKILNTKYKFFFYLISTDINTLLEKFIHNLNIENIVIIYRKNQKATVDISSHKFFETEFLRFWCLKYLFKINHSYRTSQYVELNSTFLKKTDTLLTEFLIRCDSSMDINKFRIAKIFRRYLLYSNFYVNLRYK